MTSEPQYPRVCQGWICLFLSFFKPFFFFFHQTNIVKSNYFCCWRERKLLAIWWNENMDIYLYFLSKFQKAQYINTQMILRCSFHLFLPALFPQKRTKILFITMKEVRSCGRTFCNVSIHARSEVRFSVFLPLRCSLCAAGGFPCFLVFSVALLCCTFPFV